MTFEEFPDAFVWQCEKCGLTAEFPRNDFYACVAELRARGWQFHRDDPDEGFQWHHKCVRCRPTADEILDRPFRSGSIAELHRKYAANGGAEKRTPNGQKGD
jgi:hypothetical protein